MRWNSRPNSSKRAGPISLEEWFPAPGWVAAGFIARHAYLICAGRNPDDCAALLDKALSQVRLTAHALTPSMSAAPSG